MVQRNPDNPDVLRLSGMALMETDRVPESVIVLQRAVMVDPRSGYGLALLSSAYARAGHPAEAFQAAQRAATLTDDAQTLAFAGRAMLDAGRPADAERLLTRALARAPDDPDVLTRAGYTKLALGKRADAAALFRRALSVAPAYPPAVRGLQEAGGEIR
jgi:Flp pilus assembly protein TadD